jgi:hypothetical protein
LCGEFEDDDESSLESKASFGELSFSVYLLNGLFKNKNLSKTE